MPTRRSDPADPADSLLSPCVLVVKTPVASRKPVADRLASTGARLAGEVEEAAREQEATLAAVVEALDHLGVAPVTVSVDALDAEAQRAIAGARFVVTVGGDGTLLATAHWVTGAALLGVNSAPRSSVGYLTVTRRASAARILAQIARGAFKPQKVARLDIELDGQALPPALNDVLLAHEQPAATSRYRLRLGRRVEEHRSSGLWIATAAGSTAGIHSAGGEVMPLGAQRLQFRARELYRSRGETPILASGFVEPEEKLIVESAMAAGWLYPDGARMAVRFPFGARAVFRVAAHPLRLFTDPARWEAAGRSVPGS
jgi:NAD+ kinase